MIFVENLDDQKVEGQSYAVKEKACMHMLSNNI